MCASEARHEIDAALVCGDSNRRIAARYGLSEASMRRHKAAHLPVALVASEAVREAVQSGDLYGQTEELHTRALGLLTKAETAGDLRAAVAAVHAARGCLELSAKMRTAAFMLARGATPDDPSDEEVEAATKIIDARILILEAHRGS